MIPRVRHLLLGSSLLVLGGCAPSPAISRLAPASPPRPPPTSSRDRQDLLELYSRAAVPEVRLDTTNGAPAGPRAREGGSALSSLLHREAASLRACYQLSHRRRGPSLGPVHLDVELETARRRVRSVQITGTENGRLERCLTRKIKRWRLPPRLPRTVSLPLVFQSS